MEEHSEQLPLLLLFLPLLPVLLVLFVQRKRRKPKLPPGPRRLPIVGNLHQLGKLPHRTLWELSKQYGPIMHLQLGRVPTVVVSSPQMAEEVLKTQDLKFCSRPPTTSAKRLSYNFSDVAFSPYNANWRELKKITVSMLLNSKLVDGFRPLREEEIDRMMGSIPTQLASPSSQPINLSKLLHSLASRIVCRTAFGNRFYREGQGHRMNRFHEIFLESQALFVEFFVGDFFPWLGWVDVLSGLRARLEKNFTELDTFYQQVLESHADPTRPEEDEEDFVDVLLRLQKEDHHITEHHIKGLIMNILIAGTDASSTTLEYAMAELVKNPSTMLKAQEEVRSRVGEKGKVEEDDIPHLSYLKSVVKETLRLHPVAPLLLQRETMEHAHINGYDILPNTRVIVNAWAIGRELAYWEKPDEFIPERFMDSTVDFRGHDFQFIPFGAGRRICPGLVFGIMTVELGLANLLYAFDWDVPDGMGKGGIDMDEGPGIAVHLKTCLHLNATRYKVQGINEEGWAADVHGSVDGMVSGSSQCQGRETDSSAVRGA